MQIKYVLIYFSLVYLNSHKNGILESYDRCVIVKFLNLGGQKNNFKNRKKLYIKNTYSKKKF